MMLETYYLGKRDEGSLSLDLLMFYIVGWCIFSYWFQDALIQIVMSGVFLLVLLFLEMLRREIYNYSRKTKTEKKAAICQLRRFKQLIYKTILWGIIGFVLYLISLCDSLECTLVCLIIAWLLILSVVYQPNKLGDNFVHKKSFTKRYFVESSSPYCFMVMSFLLVYAYVIHSELYWYLSAWICCIFAIYAHLSHNKFVKETIEIEEGEQ